MHLRPTWLAAAWTAFIAVCALTFEARAQNTETNPAPGVRHLHRRTADQNMNVLFVDLCAAGVSVRTTAYAERGRKTSSFGGLVGAAAAINGDFFGSGYATDGLAMHAGAAWPTGRDHTYVSPVMFGTARASIPPHEDTSGAASWAREIVSGHPSLLVAGQARDNNGDTGLCRQRHPRTAVGLTQDKRTLILAVVDGRSSTRLGFTCDELCTGGCGVVQGPGGRARLDAARCASLPSRPS